MYKQGQGYPMHFIQNVEYILLKIKMLLGIIILCVLCSLMSTIEWV